MTLSDKQYNKLVRNTRSYLRSLSSKRTSGIVTADDANRYLAKNGVRESRISDRLSIMNAIFRHGDFESAGSAMSTRESARGRRIVAWTAIN